MASRLFQRLGQAYHSSRQAVQTASHVIEEHKSLLWLLGTGSSALAGWAVYTARRLHYQRIEGEMTHIINEIKGIKKKEEVPPVSVQSTPSQLRLMLVLVPAVTSAFLFGYMIGRTTMSFHWHKKVVINKALGDNRVYVAVIPERLFESSVVANELEKAVARADKQAASNSSWLSKYFSSGSTKAKERQRLPPPSSTEGG